MAGTEPLLTLTIVLVAGIFAGQLASRFGLPSVTGQIVAGIAIGPSGLDLLHHHEVLSLQPLTHFALGFIAVTVGSYLHLTRILVARRRLLFLLLFEATVTPLLVVGAILVAFDVSWVVAVILASLAVETAPATVLAIVREARAKGVFVRTLVAAVALNNIAALCLFSIARSASAAYLTEGSETWVQLLSSPLIIVLGSAGLGAAVGLGLIAATRRVVRPDHLATASMVAILATIGLGGRLELSSLLACLVLGLVLANVTPDKEEIGDRVFKNFEGAILAVFFTLAGAELDFSYLLPGGLLALTVIGARMMGKLVSARLAMKVAGAPAAVRDNLGWALFPQAGITIGLLLSVQSDPAFESVRQLLLAVGLTAVLANELVGPILTRVALKRSGEVGKDRERVIDFLHEENISTQLQATTFEGALEELTQLLWTSHRLDPEQKPPFLESLLARERDTSTYLGEGLAIPHGEVGEGGAIAGVMGVSRKGIPVPDSDDYAHCIVLLATPRGRRDRHLEVLAAFARSIGSDPNIRQQLYEARSPAHAYQLLHAEDSESFNYFLDERAGAPRREPG